MKERLKVDPVTQGSFATKATVKRQQRREPPPEHQLKPWARTLKRLMKQHGKSQQKVADETHIDKNTLSALIHGRDTNTRTLTALAKYFDVSISEFFFDESVSLTALSQLSPEQFKKFWLRLAPLVAPSAALVAQALAQEKTSLEDESTL